MALDWKRIRLPVTIGCILLSVFAFLAGYRTWIEWRVAAALARVVETGRHVGPDADFLHRHPREAIDRALAYSGGDSPLAWERMSFVIAPILAKWDVHAAPPEKFELTWHPAAPIIASDEPPATVARKVDEFRRWWAANRSRIPQGWLPY